MSGDRLSGAGPQPEAVAAEAGGQKESGEFGLFPDHWYDVRRGLDHAGPGLDDWHIRKRGEHGVEVLANPAQDGRTRRGIQHAFAFERGLLVEGPGFRQT